VRCASETSILYNYDGSMDPESGLEVRLLQIIHIHYI